MFTSKNQSKIYIPILLLLFISMIICISIGSVTLPFKEVVEILIKGFKRIFEGHPAPLSANETIILKIRLPRILSSFLVGASLAISGASMQGLLRNPLADGSTLGISSGASLGAYLAIAFNLSFPIGIFRPTVVFAIIFALISIIIIFTLARQIDSGFSTTTIILLGVIYSMFVSAITSLIITFNTRKIESITFWSMGSLQASSYEGALVLFLVLLIFSIILISKSKELDALSISESFASNIGVDVKKSKKIIILAVSFLVGTSVAFSGTIGFVGLISPHIVRKITGPSHKKLFIFSSIFGGIFLLYADLLSRTILRPAEIPIGIITSFVGSFIFIYIFYKKRKSHA
ncbi:iron ABC transporter permease [Citroniella saccharovorans]|uniref:Iron ABC transporter permease n=1 Tax=Citroniella saccharovorans TaxID=2053367 RepID=A0AAW9MQN8_9FIRM|nr:iron ABC transporter permease [Citroniella saccharovorans]MEB3429396.1 iron ABC transporter permease [Citroniella saccharovorans]